jgi:general secretion pathway protein A
MSTYLDFYKLREEPFRLTPDPKFLQMAEPHRNALTALGEGVIGRTGLMVFSGPVGTGKTTILNGLLSILDTSFTKNKLRTAFIVNPRLSSEELLETLLLEFEVTSSSTSKPSRIAALQSLMFAASKDGGTCLLIVDEAHLLATDALEEIRLLMNAESYHQKLLQVILCGQPELTDLLKDSALRSLRQRIAVRATLRALSASESRMYISERLRIAGLQKSVPFTSVAFQRLHEFSGGVPRLINLLSSACLAIGSETRREQIGEDMVEEAALRHELELTAICDPKSNLPTPPPGSISQLAKVPSRSEL